ncbi:homoserine dehydrogenase [Colibacter massiliensis]|uniref:homoserine dehydrogenase n=1 Tax=Colibacter massiliensis TaxID=1852379 RepID=UPI0023534F5C|nr:homoserine dehydrogenase [Colibacter massiliensis]
MKNVSIALLGCGTVGKGVVELLRMNGDLIEEQLDTHLTIKYILVRNVDKYKDARLPETIHVTDDFADIINDDDVEIVIEVMGSADFAKICIEECFRKGKSVVSANKDVIADYGIPLLKLAHEHGADFQFEASVAGGIPVVRPMYSSLNSNKIEEIIGIMNGTTNFILTGMTDRELSYEEALAEAQSKGYAEADPTNDISGYDAARKIAILATLGFHSYVTFTDVSVEGIEQITKDDIMHAKAMGYRIKLLAVARQEDDGISLAVHPAFIRKDHPLANVGDAYNAVYVRGNCVGDVMFYGQGAGALPTASAVVSDVMNVIQHVNNDMTGKRPYLWRNAEIKDAGEIKTPYYIRMIAANAPGVLSSISGIFARHAISIRSLIQKDETKELAEIVILVDSSANGVVKTALEEIKELPCIDCLCGAVRLIEV